VARPKLATNAMPGDSITRRVLLGQLGIAGLALRQKSLAQLITLKADPLTGLRPVHPRLILPDSDLPRLKQLTREQPLAHKLRENLEREADRLQTTAPPDYKMPVSGLLAESRRVVDRIYTLALMYRLDSEPRHLERAVKELRAAALLPNWNPPHFLDVAEMTHAFAIGYDWLYPGLAPADRDWIREALIQKGLMPAMTAYREPSTWVTAPHHWNLVCNSGVALGALAVADEQPDLARTILRSALDSLPHALATYAPDGGWPEGPAFWNYGTRYLVYLMSALETALDNEFGLPNAKGFDRTGRFRLCFIGPTGKTFNYGDATDEAVTSAQMFWLARRFNQPVYAWAEQRDADKSSHTDPLDIVWFDKDVKPERGEEPLDQLFTGAQVAFLRTSWDDQNALFLGVKGGDNKTNRSHLDLGTFVFDAGGVRWAYDPGPEDSNAPGYLGLKRYTYFKAGTEAHNTIVIDGENQDHKAEARIIRFEPTPDLSWVEIDLSHTYPGKLKQWQRKIGMAQSRALIVQDVLEADQPVDALWSMLTEADIAVNGQTAELKKNDWTLSCEIRSPHHAVFDIVTIENARKLVVRLGSRVTELDLNIVMIPHKTGQPKAPITRDFRSA
jgi:hypothetical protein